VLPFSITIAGPDHGFYDQGAVHQEIPMKMPTLYSSDNPGIEDAFDTAANGLADSIVGGFSDSLASALADPIVRAVMAADGLEPGAFEALLRKMAAKLDTYRPVGGNLCHR
jgi:hypothetical protein